MTDWKPAQASDIAADIRSAIPKGYGAPGPILANRSELGLMQSVLGRTVEAKNLGGGLFDVSRDEFMRVIEAAGKRREGAENAKRRTTG